MIEDVAMFALLVVAGMNLWEIRDRQKRMNQLEIDVFRFAKEVTLMLEAQNQNLDVMMAATKQLIHQRNHPQSIRRPD